MSYVVSSEGMVYESDLEPDAVVPKALEAGDLAEYRVLGSPDGSWVCITAHDPRTDPFLCELVERARLLPVTGADER